MNTIGYLSGADDSKTVLAKMRPWIFSLIVMILLMEIAAAQSPYKSSWGRDGVIMGGSILTAFTASVIHDSIPPLTLHEVNTLSTASINWIDRGAARNYSSSLSAVSDVLVGTTIAAPLALLFDADIRNDCGTFVLMYLETMTFAAFIPSFGKGTVERYRPLVYNPGVPFDFKVSNDPKGSFFSGHTTWAFASAVFFATVYGDYHPDSKIVPYVWAGSLLAASSVGYLRYASGAHFPTDVITGAVVGSAIGYLVPFLHRVPSANVTIAPSSVASAPALSFNCIF